MALPTTTASRRRPLLCEEGGRRWCRPGSSRHGTAAAHDLYRKRFSPGTLRHGNEQDLLWAGCGLDISPCVLDLLVSLLPSEVVLLGEGCGSPRHSLGLLTRLGCFMIAPASGWSSACQPAPHPPVYLPRTACVSGCSLALAILWQGELRA